MLIIYFANSLTALNAKHCN